MVPVDYVAKQILYFSTHTHHFGQTFVLGNKDPLKDIDFFKVFADYFDPTLAILPLADWIEKAIQAIKTSPEPQALTPFWSLLEQSRHLELAMIERFFPNADHLMGEESQLKRPEINAALLQRYFKYFEKVGFVIPLLHLIAKGPNIRDNIGPLCTMN